MVITAKFLIILNFAVLTFSGYNRKTIKYFDILRFRLYKVLQSSDMPTICGTKKTGERRFFLGEGISFLWGLVKIYVLGVYAAYCITAVRFSVHKVTKKIRVYLLVFNK